MRVTKKFTAALAAGTLAAALTACSSDEPSGTPEATDAAPAEAEIQPAGSFDELTALMEAAQDKATSGHMEMSYSGEAAEAVGLADSTAKADFAVGDSDDLSDMTMQMSMGVMGMEFDMRMVDGTMYMNMGEMSEGKFLAMPLDEMADDPNFSSTLESMKTMDLAAQAEEVKSAVTSFEHTGTETIDGVEVDIYTMTLDPSKLEGAAAGVDPTAAEQVGEMTMVYKVTSEGLPLEADTTMEIEGQELKIDTDFSKWGEPVTVEAPPEDEVTPYSEVAGG